MLRTFSFPFTVLSSLLSKHAGEEDPTLLASLAAAHEQSNHRSATKVGAGQAAADRKWRQTGPKKEQQWPEARGQR